MIENRMKLRIKEMLSVWCAILIAVVSLGFSIWQVRRVNQEMAKMGLVDQGILERLDYFEVRKITEKLPSQKANIFLCKWRDCAMQRGFVNMRSTTPRGYEINESGRDLVKALDSEVFPLLAEMKGNNPNDTTADILSAVNLTKLYKKLYDYNKKNSSSIPMETVVGILVTYLVPSAEMS